MKVQDHPGFLGVTSRGYIAIHADWPIYPEEHGADLALLWLTAFPEGTSFCPIDDIDRCSLLLADTMNVNRVDPFDKKNLHIAIWHEDLLALHKSGLIDGITPVTERQWEELQRAAFAAQLRRIVKKDVLPEEYGWQQSLEWCDEEDLSFPAFPSCGMAVSHGGRRRIASLLSKQSDSLAILGSRIERLIEMRFFDTAVREVCLNLEYSIRTHIHSTNWGERLIDDFMHWLTDDEDIRGSYIKVLRGQIRNAFKLIRNRFMHNSIQLDELQCHAILHRLALVQSSVNDVLVDYR